MNFNKKDNKMIIKALNKIIRKAEEDKKNYEGMGEILINIMTIRKIIKRYEVSSFFYIEN